MAAEMEGQGKNRASQWVGGKDLPPLIAGEYIWNAFEALGRIQWMPMGGMVAIPFAELQAYAWASEGLIGEWECRVLRNMSAAYVSGAARGKDPFEDPPWRPE